MGRDAGVSGSPDDERNELLAALGVDMNKLIRHYDGQRAILTALDALDIIDGWDPDA